MRWTMGGLVATYAGLVVCALFAGCTTTDVPATPAVHEALADGCGASYGHAFWMEPTLFARTASWDDEQATTPPPSQGAPVIESSSGLPFNGPYPTEGAALTRVATGLPQAGEWVRGMWMESDGTVVLMTDDSVPAHTLRPYLEAFLENVSASPTNWPGWLSAFEHSGSELGGRANHATNSSYFDWHTFMTYSVRTKGPYRLDDLYASVNATPTPPAKDRWAMGRAEATAGTWSFTFTLPVHARTFANGDVIRVDAAGRVDADAGSNTPTANALVAQLRGDLASLAGDHPTAADVEPSPVC